jgi:hypothetical protein
MDEKRKAEIRKEAKKILDEFGKAIEKVDVAKKDLKKEVGGFRKEGKGKKADAAFRQRMFENAPAKEGDYVLAEKKNW